MSLCSAASRNSPCLAGGIDPDEWNLSWLVVMKGTSPLPPVSLGLTVGIRLSSSSGLLVVVTLFLSLFKRSSLEMGSKL